MTDDGTGDTRSTSALPVVVVVLSIAVLVAAVDGALRSVGAPIASLLVDPYGAFSEVHLSEWGTEGLRLCPSSSGAPRPDSSCMADGDRPRYPDQLLAVDGEPIAPDLFRLGDYPSSRISRRLRGLAAGSSVVLEFDRNGERRWLRAPVRPLGPTDVLFLFGSYALTACLVLWSGIAVFLVAGRRAAARAYLFFACGAFLWLTTLYDYHTSTSMAPLLITSMVGVTMGCLWLAYAFPEPPTAWREALRAALLAVAVVGAGVSAWLFLAPMLGRNTRWMSWWIRYAFSASQLILAVSLLLRLHGSRGHSRRELLSATGGLVLAPAVTLGGFLLGGDSFSLVAPLVVGLLPVSLGYALIRHNILAAPAILSWKVLLFPVLVVAALGALFGWRVSRSVIERPEALEAISWAWGAVLFAAFTVGLRQFAVRKFFTATAKFRPTVEQLTDRLASQRDRREVVAAIEDTVEGWLRTQVKVLSPPELSGIEPLRADASAQLAAGQRVWTQENSAERRLLLPMRSLGELRGVLMLAPKRELGLYTSEDLALLETVAAVGAVALHNLDVLGQLDEQRRLEVEAGHTEKRLALGLLGAELSHEIAYPLNFFRFLLQRFRGGAPLESTDVEIGEEEVERLERMLVSLRKLDAPRPRLQSVRVAPVARHAVSLLREITDAKNLNVKLDIAEELQLVADPDPLLQLLANLLRNAAQATPPGGALGLGTSRRDGQLILEVWDSGPGVPDELKMRIFAPFVTTKEGSSGLGLAVSQRIARSFGWSLSVGRRGDRTCFTLTTGPSPAAEVPPRGAPAQSSPPFAN